MFIKFIQRSNGSWYVENSMGNRLAYLEWSGVFNEYRLGFYNVILRTEELQEIIEQTNKITKERKDGDKALRDRG